jgi:non-ribosomal peptide synthase protein (TIGR01720 family)
VLPRALHAVGERHEALRLRARRDAGGDWQLDLPLAAAPLALRRVDLSDLPAAERSPMLERCATQVQADLDLAAGRPAAAVLFHLGAGEDDRLLLAIHHLAVDGVSWRILAEDLETACRQLQRGEPLRLAPRTTSIQEWGHRLRDHLAQPRVAAEIEHWMAVTARSGALDLDDPHGDDSVAAERSLTVRLEARRTSQLLVEAPRAYQNRVEEILLAALLRVFCQRPRRAGLRLDLERHGRSPIAPDLDLARTVGWFTALFPVWLELPRRESPGDLLKAVKEQLRAVPGDGLGYGLLRHLRGDPRLASAPPSAIVFNYHGRIDPGTGGGSLFTPAAESPGALHDPAGRRPHELEITGAVTAGELEITWSWSAARLRPATVEGWALRHLAAVEELVLHCLEPGAAGYTPSDFPEAGFDQEDLEDFLHRLPEPEV